MLDACFSSIRLEHSIHTSDARSTKANMTKKGALDLNLQSSGDTYHKVSYHNKITSGNADNTGAFFKYVSKSE